ncbi:OPT oligopeptide transporter protein-domain-containing protein [Limtongia smithiae]|uniref:OPT oligopeptide transporter protein-domain-containing protein n=1 Tax=Limtongia smithiae TaxID=1125753 RepID=UPI0034CEB3EE
MYSEDYSEKQADVSITDLDEKYPATVVVSADDATILERYTEKAHNGHLNVAARDLEMVMDKIMSISAEQAKEILIHAIEHHRDDINFPVDTMDRIILLVDGPLSYGQDIETYDFDLKADACLIHYFSPYPEVRCVTDPYDDPAITCESFRVYMLAIAWTMLSTGVSQFFIFRQPSISITSSVIQLFLFPLGKLMSYILPDWGFTFRGTRYTLNPGEWTYKEQMLATVMVNVANASTYVAESILMTQHLDRYYGYTIPIGYQFLLNFSSQYFGFAFAGVLRRWVIYPVRSIWPTTLPTLALNRALLKPEKAEKINGWSISRYRFFCLVFILSFLYFWIPDYLFKALSTFNWMTWIKPTSHTLAVIGGSTLGIGFNPIPSFDWNILNYQNALSIPFYSQANQVIGTFLGGIGIIGMYFTNFHYSSYVPVNTNELLDRYSEQFNVTKVLTNGLMDEAKYKEYSPPYYSAGFMMTYGSYFAMYTLGLIYIFAKEWKPISQGVRDFWRALVTRRSANYDAFKDHNSVLMSKYKEVPDYYYLGILLISFTLGVICVEVYREQTQTPVYAIVVVILATFVFLPPIVILRSITGWSLQISVMSEMIAGFMLPGNGMANLVLKCYGTEAESQSEGFVQDLKIAHYARLPPRAVFRGQLVATFIQCITSIGVLNWQMANINGLCETDQADKFTCPGLKTCFSASVVWGVIGPLRTFRGLYSLFAWCFLIGGGLAVVCYFLSLKFPKVFRYFNPVLVVGGMGLWAPYNMSYYTGGLYLSFFFMHYIRRRYVAWWEKYNYVLSAALTAGVAFSAIIIYFSVQYHAKTISWWGNDVISAGVDGGVGQQTRFALPEKGWFGLEPGEWK